MHYIWLVLMVLFLIAEAATLGISTIWFAIGALLAFLVTLAGAGVWVQITVFLVSSIVLLYFTRPLAKKYLKVGTHVTNADSLIGCDGIVTKPIEQFTTGQVKVRGQIWTSVSDDGSPITLDTVIRVQRIEGVKLVVQRVTEGHIEKNE